jgi:RNA polymerase sigma-70 factor (ECF subfamily)
MSEADEWADACAGDSGAFAVLFDRHRERVFRLGLRLSGNRHDALDRSPQLAELRR